MWVGWLGWWGRKGVGGRPAHAVGDAHPSAATPGARHGGNVWSCLPCGSREQQAQHVVTRMSCDAHDYRQGGRCTRPMPPHAEHAGAVSRPPPHRCGSPVVTLTGSLQHESRSPSTRLVGGGGAGTHGLAQQLGQAGSHGVQAELVLGSALRAALRAGKEEREVHCWGRRCSVGSARALPPQGRWTALSWGCAGSRPGAVSGTTRGAGGMVTGARGVPASPGGLWGAMHAREE